MSEHECERCSDDRSWFERLPADDQVFVAVLGGLGALVFLIMFLAALS
jgi:hypothetical protein